MEFLGWQGHTNEGFIKSTEFINKANIFNLSENIINHAINLKRNHKIKLIDAIICSTALLNNMELVTRNVGDFKSIKNLKLINPLI